MDPACIRSLILALLFVILSGIFSATEMAFSTFNRIRMKNMAADGHKRAALVLRLAEDFDGLLSTILVGNNIVNIALTAIMTVLFVKWFPTNGAALSTAVTAVVVLLFGEISPKSIAKESPDSFVLFIAPLMRVLIFLLTPLNFFFRGWKKLLSKIFRFKGEQGMTEDELITIVDEAEEDGGINEREGELIRSVIEFDDADVEEILTPRVDVTAIEKGTPLPKVADIFASTGYSRLPVYGETMDDIIGVIHEKDFYALLRRGGKKLDPILRKPLFVPCHIKISKLLSLFQEAKTHLAVVLDDYGGTMGIATLEDVIEELVGEIWDEHDEVVEQISEEADGRVIFAGDAPLSELFEYYGIDAEDDEDLPQTVSGWVTMQLGHFPETGETFAFEGLEVSVTAIDGRVAESITVTDRRGKNEKEDAKA